jgi:hypothetical protein
LSFIAGSRRWNWLVASAPRTSHGERLANAPGVDRRELAQAARARLEAQRPLVDGVHEAGMVDRAVVAHEVVLDRDLPVRPQLVGVAAVEAQSLELQAVRGDDRRQVAQGGGERLGVRVGIDEHERPPRVDRDRAQPELVALEARLEVAARAARSAPSRP